jgi:hypothetical protein
LPQSLFQEKLLTGSASSGILSLMNATHWTKQPANDTDLARTFLFVAPPAANALKIRLAKEYAGRAQDAEAFWAVLADYMGKSEVARLRA